MTTVAQKPKNEAERLAELERYGILDTLPEKAFDDLTRIAASICNTPISLVSMVDSNRQWFKSATGINGVTETSRDIAFCAHAILDTNTMVVPDATADPRFANNPLVTGEHRIRFYAGAPLISPNGYAVGTLCAIDHAPREITQEQRLALEALARQVVDQMELRVNLRTLKHQAQEIEKNRENALCKILDTMQSGLFVVGRDAKIERSNVALRNMLGFSEQELLGMDAKLVFGGDNIVSHGEPEQWQLDNGSLQTENTLRAKDGRLVPVILSASVLVDPSGGFGSWVCIAHDLTATRALQEQLLSGQKLEAIGRLAAGISHEINTPIQFIGDNTRFLLDAFKDFVKAMEFIKRSAESNGPLAEEAQVVLKELDLDFLREEAPRAIEQTLEGVGRVSRIVRAMKEFSHPGSDQKQLVNINRLIESTVTVSTNEWKYVATVETEFDADLPLIPCLPGEFNQVVLNIIVNAAHALEESVTSGRRDKGLIKITTKRSPEYAVVSIHDNGCGIQPEIINRIFDPFFTTKEVGKGTGQGLAIARSVVVDKHNGKLEVESSVGVGTTFKILLPLKEHAHALKSTTGTTGVRL